MKSRKGHLMKVDAKPRLKGLPEERVGDWKATTPAD